MNSLILLILFAIYASAVLYARAGLRKSLNRDETIDLHETSVLPFSIIIAAHNEEGHLPALLNSLKKQNIDWNGSEIILVLDRCTDNSAAVVTEFCDGTLPLKMIEINEPDENVSPKKNALRKGLHAAENRIILQTDADAALPPDWIRSHVNLYRRDSHIGAIMGLFRFRTRRNFLGLWVSAEKSFNFLLSAGVAAFGKVFSAFGVNVSYNRDEVNPDTILEKFSHSLSGDDDLIFQELVRQKKKIAVITDPMAAPLTDVPHSFSAFFRQRKRHLSAGKNYEGFAVKFYGIILLSWSVLWFAGFSSYGALLVLVIKGILDVLLLYPLIKNFTNIKKMPYILLGVLIFEIFYVPYIWLMGSISRFSKISW